MSIYIGPDAQVYGSARVSGSAQVYGSAWVSGSAQADSAGQCAQVQATARAHVLEEARKAGLS